MAYQSKASKEWFERNGVEAPEVVQHYSDDELAKKFQEQSQSTIHGDWLQIGNTLHCRKCNNHGLLIDTSKVLVGTDDKGLPILNDIV
jgi:hypothetical protein